VYSIILSYLSFVYPTINICVDRGDRQETHLLYVILQQGNTAHEYL